MRGIELKFDGFRALFYHCVTNRDLMRRYVFGNAFVWFLLSNRSVNSVWISHVIGNVFRFRMFNIKKYIRIAKI